MRCPHCHRDFISPVSLWALNYMVGKGWLFKGTLDQNKWKSDAELVDWLHKGWIEMHPKHGFRITPTGEEVVTASLIEQPHARHLQR